MRNSIKLTAAASVLALLNGCAEVPKVSRTYCFPEGRADIVVTQTLGCMVTSPTGDPKKMDVPGDSPIVKTTATATVTYSYVPNYDSPKPAHVLRVDKVDRFISDSDVALTLTDDGRLASINSASVGEAAAIIKSVITIAAVFTGVKPLSFTRVTCSPEMYPI